MSLFFLQRLRLVALPVWTQLLLGIYCFLYFLPNVTRYKNLTLILLLITAVVMLWRGEARIRPLWRQIPVLALLLLVAAVVYGCVVSPHPMLSLQAARTPIFIDCLLVGLFWSVALQGTATDRIAWALTVGFIGSLAVLLIHDFYRYYQDSVTHDVGFGTNFDHRELSYPLLVTLPFALVGLRQGRVTLRALSLLLLLFLMVSLLGTGSRGAWLAAAVVVIIWTVHYRVWKSAFVAVLFASAFAAGAAFLFPSSVLVNKFHQTDSNHRWSGGVQSAAIDLIFENPVRGYGFGDEIYADVYNHRVPAHPEWTEKASMGPHNMTLRMWFASGFPGLVAILGIYLAITWTALHIARRTSGVTHDAVFAVLLAFVGAIFVRGLFESAYMNYFGWMIGSLAAFSMNYTASREERNAARPLPQAGHGDSSLDNGKHSKTASILVIRRDNIGDLVCTTPLIHALRERFPQARVCVLVNSYNRPVVENNPDIDAVYAYTKAKHREKGESVPGVYWRRLRLMLELRRQNFDYAIIAGAHFLPRALRFARLIRPKHIIGFTEAGKRGVRHIDMGIPYTLPHPLHEAEDIFRLLAPLGIEGEPPAMRVFPEAAAVARAQAVLREKKLAPDNVIGVHISARKPANRWPAEHFIALIRRLREKHQAAFMLFWSPGSASNPRHPGDDEKARQIMSGLGDVPILAYPTDQLDQLIAGLSLCRAVVCSDGGAMHIAAALGKPILCFFGKSDRTRWYPWKTRHVLLQPPSLDVADIGVDEAVVVFEQLHAGASRDTGAAGAKRS